MIEITLARIAAILSRLPAALRFWKDLTRGFPVQRAIEATAAEHHRALAPAIRTSFHNWFTTEEATSVLRAVSSGGAAPEVSERLIDLFVDHSSIPGLTEELARDLVSSFIQNLEKAHLEQEERDALWRLRRSVTSTVDRQLGRFREDVRQAVVEAHAMAGAPHERGPDREWHRRIDEGKKLADQEKWSAALQLYRQIESEAKEANGIGARVWYRLNVNLGACLFALGREEDARPYFERALDYEPEDALALGQLAQLDMELGNRTAAAEHARRAVAKDPSSPIGWNVLVQTSERELAPEEIPEALRESWLILVGRGIVALRHGRTDEGILLFRQALRNGPRDAQMLVVLVESLLVKRVEEHPFAPFSPELRREVIRLSTEAIEQLEGAERPELLSRALVARAIAALEDDEAAAMQDFKRAGELDPDSAAQKFNISRVLFRRGRPDGALFLLDQIPEGEHTPLVQSLRARALLALDRPAEVADAIRAAHQAREDALNPAALAVDLADTATRADLLDLAEELLAGIEAGEEESRAAVLRGRMAVARGDMANARGFYERALETALEEERADVALEYAMQLLRAGDPAAARPYFDMGNAAEGEDFHRSAFAQCLVQSEDWSGAAELLERMEGEGDLPDWALDLGGIIGLQRDDLPGAVNYLEQLLARQPGVAETRIRLAYALQRRDEWNRSLEVLDPLRERRDLDSRDLARIAQLYSLAGRRMDALALTYRAVRLSPDDPEIKRLYLKFFIERGGESAELDVSQIGPDTWVRLTEVGGSRSIERFIVGDQPHVGHPIEMSATDERAQRLLGRRVGDIVPYHVGQLSETHYRIAEIKAGYEHVFQDIMSRFTTQHPEFEAIQSFHIDESKLLDSFTPVFVSVDRRAAQTEQVLAYYTSHGMPLGFVAEQVGCSLREAYDVLAHNRERFLLVERGDSTSRAQSRNAAGQATPIILTISGLVTLLRLARLDLLTALGRELLAPQSLLDDLAAEIRELEGAPKRGGTKAIAKVGEQYLFVETTAEQVQARIDEAAALRDFVAANARILPRPFSALDKAAEDIRDAIGASSYDAYALAGPDVTLFADDLGLRSLAANEHGAPGFPTAALLEAAHARGLLPREALLRDLARLVEMNHAFVPVTADVLYVVLADNAFELNPVVLRALDRLSPEHASHDAVEVAADLLRKLALSPVGEGKLESIAALLFERVSRGRPTRSVMKAFNAAIQQRFALLPLDYQRVRERMDAFLVARTGHGLE